MNQVRWRWMMDLEDQASRVKSSLSQERGRNQHKSIISRPDGNPD